MEKTDARTHSPQTQYEHRKQVIRLRKKGITNKETAEIVGISITNASTIWQTFLRGGIEAIKPKARGRRHGEKRKLKAEQETAIQKLLVDKTPDQMKLPFALWTRDAVRLAIHQRYRIDLPLRTITDYLKRWGFTPQKPVKRAYEQNPKKVAHWLETEYPTIAARAKQEKAEIHWGDETGIQNDAYTARGFSPQGESSNRAAQRQKSKNQHDIHHHKSRYDSLHDLPGNNDREGAYHFHVPTGQGRQKQSVPYSRQLAGSPWKKGCRMA